ncbi:MAG: hypothetical protein JXR96_17305 [Deltaproteobacteria bacterium]|nr:hypothetical protein [Deltaproteobacteria bacterium]
MIAGPLHQAGLDADQAWGSEMRIACACGGELGLWSRKCAACKAKNSFPRLLGKRARIEAWLDGRIQRELLPRLEEAQVLVDSARKYDKVLRAVLERPFPAPQKKEDLKLFMRRVLSFFPSMFKSTSPRQMAFGTDDSIKRSSVRMAIAAREGCEGVLTALTGLRAPVAAALPADQAERVAADLRDEVKPYIEALQTLQLAHNRMVTSYGPARAIFSRPVQTGVAKGLWNKARLKLKPVGARMRLPTAIWQSPAEHEELKRLDGQLEKFMQQIGWFTAQCTELEQRHAQLVKTYSLSLRKHLIQGLARRYAAAEPAARPLMVKRILSKKGVGSWLWRLCFGVKTT